MTSLDEARSDASTATLAHAESRPPRRSPDSIGPRFLPAAATAADSEGPPEELADPARITVAIGRFGALIGRGLTEVIGEDVDFAESVWPRTQSTLCRAFAEQGARDA